ncbi:hypothetical protein [Micromonospora sp. NPDC048843]|uniref:hypothetical protein n=1 Tax=Micromonospora sp. NPDC048843 TaxID=3155389 RepID=UPI00340023F6
MIDDSGLARWVQTWARRYPAEHDRVLAPLLGAKVLDRSAVLTVIGWKFNAMAHRWANAGRGLARETDQTIRDVTAAARGCQDDGAAMRVIRVLQGVGPALGSALLMTMDPLRWTVLDERAVKSINALGYAEVPLDSQDRQTWLPYLRACLDLHTRTGEPLRDVDRALYAAKGNGRVPVV